jgi:pimeloyl-ACP methyl ester carboxylesterase
LDRSVGSSRASGPGAGPVGAGPVGIGPIIAVVLLLSACGSSATSSPNLTPTPAPAITLPPTPSVAPSGDSEVGSLRWRACGAPFECATLTVPLDHANPGGRTIDLGLIRLPAKDAAGRIGSLVTNPGGPGGSGVDFVRNSGASVFSRLQERFDIVSFDPRGVGESSPISCLSGSEMDELISLDPTPDTGGERDALIEGAREFVMGCERESGDILPFLSTDAVARDLDLIRAALGEDRLTYLGFSYGTFLGTVYASLYPDRIRAFVLDGAVDATLDTEAQLTEQATGFEQALDRFLADCAKRPACSFHEGGNTAAAFDALMERIDDSALPAVATRDSRPVGPGEAFNAMVVAMYDKSLWDALAQGLALAERGDGSILLLLSDALTERQPDGSYGSLIPVLNATNCLDYPAPTDVAFYDGLAMRLEQKAPRFGEAFGYSFTCAFWPIRSERSLDPIAATGAPPLLVVGSTGDPATPYEWSVKLAAQLESGVLLTRDGEGHTAYGGTSACIDGAVDAYLIDLSVPKDGTVCRS